MKLADWLVREHMTPEQLRVMLGVENRSTVMRWLNGTRIPRPVMLHKINDRTGGEVTVEDFLDQNQPMCAVAVTGLDGAEKRIFPWTPGTATRQAQPRSTPVAHASEQPPNAITVARKALGARVTFTKRGAFILDGRVTDLGTVIREANVVRRARGAPEIVEPGAGGLDL